MTPLEIYKFVKYTSKRIEFENDMADRRTARICCIIANKNRKKGSKAFTEEQFIPKKKKSRKQMSVNDLSTTLKMITLMFNGTITRKNR